MKKKPKQERCSEQSDAVHEFNGSKFTRQCLHDAGHPGDHLFRWKRVQ